MAHGISIVRNLPMLGELPRKSRALTVKAIEEHDARLAAEHEARSRKAAEIAERTRRRLIALFGADNWSALRHAMRQERLAVSQLLQPPSGLTLDVGKAQKGRIRKIDRLVAGSA